MCLLNILFPEFMCAFIFHWPSFTPCWLLLVEHSLLAASISRCFEFSCFSSYEIRLLCFESLALALSLLST